METIYIKNMVCPQCIKTVASIFQELGQTHAEVGLGYVENVGISSFNLLDHKLEAEGYERLIDKEAILAGSIKNLLIGLISKDDQNIYKQNISFILTEKLGKPHPELAASFQKHNDQSIKAYWQALRLEKAKEWLSYGELAITEIAKRSGYNSLQAFSKAFKSKEGNSPSEFRKAKPTQRKMLNSL